MCADNEDLIKEYKRYCYDSAQLIPNWKNIDKNELCRIYVDLKKQNNDLSDNYLAAILYNFWNVTESNYYKQAYKIATEGDCIDWTVTGVLKALNQHVWDNEDNILYNDPKGPEKAINVCIYSTKLNFYQKIKHQKEKLSYESYSLDQLLENSSDSYYIPIHDEDNTVDNYIYFLIKDSFFNKEYIKAFTLDIIMNNDVFDDVVENGMKFTAFSDKKLRHKLKFLDDDYVLTFSNKYGIIFDDVKNSLHYVTDLSHDALKDKIDTLLFNLKHDRNLVNYLVR